MADKSMPFFEHLSELRKRLIRSVIALVIATSICYLFSYQLLDLVIRPAGEIKLHYLSPMEPLMAQIKIAIFAGAILTSPVWIYQIMAFAAPALRKKEKKVIFPLVLAIGILFIAGVLFGYFYIMPAGIKWLLSQGKGYLKQTMTVDRYISFAGWFLLAFGLSFETPIVVLSLIKLGVVERKSLRKNWRYVYVIVLVLAAIITPDWNPVTMLLMALPMIVLFELTLLIGRFV